MTPANFFSNALRNSDDCIPSRCSCDKACPVRNCPPYYSEPAVFAQQKDTTFYVSENAIPAPKLLRIWPHTDESHISDTTDNIRALDSIIGSPAEETNATEDVAFSHSPSMNSSPRIYSLRTCDTNITTNTPLSSGKVWSSAELIPDVIRVPDNGTLISIPIHLVDRSPRARRLRTSQIPLTISKPPVRNSTASYHALTKQTSVPPSQSNVFVGQLRFASRGLPFRWYPGSATGSSKRPKPRSIRHENCSSTHLIRETRSFSSLATQKQRLSLDNMQQVDAQTCISSTRNENLALRKFPLASWSTQRQIEAEISGLSLFCPAPHHDKMHARFVGPDIGLPHIARQLDNFIQSKNCYLKYGNAFVMTDHSDSGLELSNGYTGDLLLGLRMREDFEAILYRKHARSTLAILERLVSRYSLKNLQFGKGFKQSTAQNGNSHGSSLSLPTVESGSSSGNANSSSSSPKRKLLSNGDEDEEMGDGDGEDDPTDRKRDKKKRMGKKNKIKQNVTKWDCPLFRRPVRAAYDAEVSQVSDCAPGGLEFRYLWYVLHCSLLTEAHI